MNLLTGWDRQQAQLLPPCVEDYVGPDNPVRFLEAFVNGLDLRAAGFQFPKENPAGRGRPAYPPADLLKLYLYGYLHQVRSSRRLAAECGRNLEVIWLLRQLTPDFKTIADFRKDNAAAFQAVVREFTRLCRQLDLFGGQLTDKGRLLFNYDQPPACAACPVKARCTAAAFRTVSRWEHEACLERMAQKVAAAPEKLAARKTLIEHVWGTFKGLLPSGFLVRGLVKVGAEVSLAHFGYNFKRALAVVGLANLLAAWKASQPASVAVTVAAK